MVKIVTNSLGSGDWIIVLGQDGSELFCGHSIGVHQLQEILSILARDLQVELLEVTDEQIEHGNIDKFQIVLDNLEIFQ